MILDARQLPSDQVIECDVCIVGGGPAGIVLARELGDTWRRVVVLESGGMKSEEETQELDKADVVNPRCHPPLHQFRQRRLGGTTNVWSGRCAPLDTIDFVPRSHVPYSGWPISKEELDPYYVRAHGYCELGKYSYGVSEALPDEPGSIIPALRSANMSIHQLWRYSPPTNFRKVHTSFLKRSPHIRVFLHATCMKILTNQSGSLVTQLKVASLRRNEFFVHAKQYVLAAGCLESTRLLLLSDDANPCGLANEADLVGRFYMSHLHGSAGEVEITPRGEPTIWDYEQTPEGVYCKRMVRISEATQQTAELLNFSSILSPPELDNPRHRNGVLSAKYLTNCVISRVAPQTNATVISMAGDLRPLGLRSHLKNIALDFPHVVGFSGKWASNKFAGRRKLLALGLNGGSNIFTLEFDAEQAPNPDSRVVLDDKKDTFGLQRLKVDWRVTDLDVLSALASIEMIGKALTQSGAGRLKIAPDLAPGLTLRKATGGHHIGTTRMAREPYRGVVDEHCQVHGVPNLHISSSSVFATSGYANPTLTVLALAIRLADRLKLVHLRR